MHSAAHDGQAGELFMNSRMYGLAVRFGLTALVAAPAALFATPAPVAPPSRTQLLFEWRGRVDKEIQIKMRGNRTAVDLIGNREYDDGSLRRAGKLPKSDAVIRVQTLEGRGQVDVIQQPNRNNDYTAIIRLRDPRSGADTYRIRAYVTSSNDDRWDNRRNDRNDDGGWNGRHRRRDRDDRDRDDDDDRDSRNDIPTWPTR